MQSLRASFLRIPGLGSCGWKAVGVAMVGLLAPLSAIASVGVEFLPEVPLWDEPVTVRVDGSDDCAIHTLSEPEIGFDSSLGRFTVDMDLTREACPGTNPPIPFSVEREIGRLEPRFWTVRIHEGSTVSSRDFAVHGRADLDLIPPESPPTDAGPFELELTGVDVIRCLSLQGPEVEGSVVEIFFDDSCPILPPGNPPIPFVEPVEVGPLAPGTYEVRIFDITHTGNENLPPALTKRELVVHDAGRCVPSDTVLCLQDGRFRVEVDWREFGGDSGEGQAVSLPGRDDTGLFWFFDESNVELTVKLLRACPVNGHHWFFLASGSTVEYHVTVIDTESPLEHLRIYSNQLGEVPALIPDTTAFSCP